MKLNKLALCMGLAGSMSAYVGVVNATALTETPDITVYLSGSTAQFTNTENAVKSLCDAATWEKYVDNTTGGSRYRTYFCTTGANAPVQQQNKKLMVRLTGYTTTVGSNTFSSGIGGSLIGANPIINKEKLNFMAVAPGLTCPSNKCDDTAPGVVAHYVPHLGITDVHPRLFTLQNAPAEAGAVTAAGLAQLEIKPGVITIFNTAVSKALRDALQDAQKATLSASPYNCAYTGASPTNREAGECTPSLTGEQLAKIYTGQVSTWNEVDAALAVKDIKVVRREIGSGTQATLNLSIPSKNFAEPAKAYPCQAGAQPTVYNRTGVVVAATSGEVETALTSDPTAWAIGFLSTDRNAPTASPFKDYRFIMIDRVAPTLTAVANGQYRVVSQGTYQRRTDLASDPNGGADVVAIVDAIAAQAVNPAIIKDAITTASKFSHAFGWTGYMAVGNTSCANEAACKLSPVTSYRFAADPNGAPNNCIAPTATF